MEEAKKEKKIKILTISDHPLSPSGVGTQTKYFIIELLKTGRYEFVSLGAAMKHQNYEPQKTKEFGDDWIIYPIDGYGDADTIRSIIIMFGIIILILILIKCGMIPPMSL